MSNFKKRKIIEFSGRLNSNNWLVYKESTDDMQILHRQTGNLKTIKKEGKKL